MSERKILSKQEVHDCLLGIMNEITRVAKILNIKFYLMYGTLIGAVRHKGFIPWDDDVDICMFRPDVEVFISEFNRLADSRYRLIHYSNTDQYFWTYPKVIDTHTSLNEKTLLPRFEYGLFVDVFPIDFVSFGSQSELDEYQIRLIQFNRQHMISAVRYAPWRWKIANIWNLIIYKGKKRFSYIFKNPSDIAASCDRYIVSCSTSDSDNVRIVSSVPPLKGIVLLKKEWFTSAVSVPFEGLEFFIPNGYDSILRAYYGDYMTPPDEGNRKGEHFENVVWRV